MPKAKDENNIYVLTAWVFPSKKATEIIFMSVPRLLARIFLIYAVAEQKTPQTAGSLWLHCRVGQGAKT